MFLQCRYERFMWQYSNIEHLNSCFPLEGERSISFILNNDKYIDLTQKVFCHTHLLIQELFIVYANQFFNSKQKVRT